MDLEVRHLRLVQAVAAAGSLTRAGSTLNLTQSALSHQLRDIESRLATPLFLRVGKRMMLTPAGECVLRSADEIVASLERTEAAVRQLSGNDRGVLRIATECYTCYHWLPPLMKRFHRQYPRIDIRIDPAATHRPVSQLVEGHLEMAIVSDPPRDRRIVLRPLFDDELVAIVSPSHRLAGHRYLKAEDFAAETLVSFCSREESTVCQDILLPAGVAPIALQQVQLTEAVIELVKAGMGIAVLAWWAVEPAVRAGTLRAVPVTRRGLRRRWSAATLKDVARLPHVRAFIDLIAERPPFRTRIPPRELAPRQAAAAG